MDAKQDVRTLFLEEFVKRLIVNSLNKHPTISRGKDLFEKLENISKAPPVLEIKKPEIKKEIPKIQPQIIKPRQIQPVQVKPMPIQPQRIVQKQPEMPPVQIPTSYVMGKLNPILADPSVQLINCPGPNKNILVMRRGMIQQINLLFTADEIKLFLKEVSEKTKIPLLSGLFKVIFQNLTITAVVSEFIGSRFIIEKKTIQQLPPQQIPTRTVQFR